MNTENLSENNANPQNFTCDVFDFAKALCARPQKPSINPLWDSAVFSLAYVLSDYAKAASGTGELYKDSVHDLLKEVFGQDGREIKENLSAKLSGFYEERPEAYGAQEFKYLMSLPADPARKSFFQTLQSVATDLIVRLQDNNE